jgi:hypothetical protein
MQSRKFSGSHEADYDSEAELNFVGILKPKRKELTG